MLIGPTHTLEDIASELQNMFPHLLFLFSSPQFDGNGPEPLSFSHTIPEAGTRIKKEKEFIVTPDMTVDKLCGAFFLAYMINIHVCYVTPDDDKAHEASERQLKMPLCQLETLLAHHGYVKYPGTDEAHVDENEKRTIEESLGVMMQQDFNGPQLNTQEKPKSKSALTYIIIGVLLAMLVFGIIGAFVE